MDPTPFEMDQELLDRLTKRDVREAEEALMLAILEDAIACFQKYALARGGKARALFQEAEDWILDESSDWLFSFENVCEVLGLNPKYVRQGLLQWKKKAELKDAASRS